MLDIIPMKGYMLTVTIKMSNMDTEDFVEAWNNFCIQTGRPNKQMIFQNCKAVVNELYGTDEAWSIACKFAEGHWKPEDHWIAHCSNGVGLYKHLGSVNLLTRNE